MSDRAAAPEAKARESPTENLSTLKPKCTNTIEGALLSQPQYILPSTKSDLLE